jgi:hypothetical protein
MRHATLHEESIMKARWQDGLNILLGIWLFVSPWVFGLYSTAADWNFFIIGVAVVVFGIAAMNQRALWEESVNFVLGVWMFFSPWLVGYSAATGLRDNAVIVGLAVVILSLWAYFERRSHTAPVTTH